MKCLPYILMKVLLVIKYCSIILSMLFMLGIPNLLKLYYVKKYRDILREDLKKSLQEKKQIRKDRILLRILHINRMTKAWNEKNQKAVYEYNGLGHRVGKQVEGTETIEYILDFTKNYYNLLQKEENGEVQSYIWDSNLVSTVVDNRKVYYFEDNLGSPIRLVYGSRKTAEVYGYDEFGNDLYGNQGHLQSFGYTGYQMDEISGTYFAQAREYAKGVAVVEGGVVLGYGIYRFVRFILSIFPALWWTIPANAVCP